MTNPSPIGPLRDIAEELRAIAAYGLNFAQNPHDVERYQAVLAASARLSGWLEGRPWSELLAAYQAESFHLSAMPSGEAVVIEDGKILLVKRRDDGLWALPGGIGDPGETLAETTRRELYEETGICGQVVRLLGIFDSRLWESEKKVHFYHAVFQLEPDRSQAQARPEVAEVGFFAEAALPPLSPGHHRRVPFVLRQLRGAAPLPFFDQPVKNDCQAREDED